MEALFPSTVGAVGGSVGIYLVLRVHFGLRRARRSLEASPAEWLSNRTLFEPSEQAPIWFVIEGGVNSRVDVAGAIGVAVITSDVAVFESYVPRLRGSGTVVLRRQTDALSRVGSAVVDGQQRVSAWTKPPECLIGALVQYGWL